MYNISGFLKPEIVDDPYSRKMHIDAEKRAERIKRMYSQIEKASLSDSLNAHRTDVTAELLGSQHHYQQTVETSLEEGHTPVFKPYQHAVIATGPDTSNDPFCDPLDRGDGYPKMHWRYASHPHIMYGSPGGANKHSREHQQQGECAKRPLLLESDVDNPQVELRGTCSQFPTTFSSSATFQPSKTVKADVTSSDCPLEDDCSSPCFLQRTDSLETVVAAPKTEAPLRAITKDIASPQPSQSWNMTTV